QFPQEALASTLAADGKLTAVHITRMATDLARFHSLASVAKAETAYGGERCVRDQMGRVIQQLLPLAREADDALKLQALWVWIEQEYSRLEEVLAARKRNGFVRECHGDLHLGNVVLINGLLTPFDGIEFNPALRWVDVMSEVAFPVMDLVHGRRSDLASLFVDAYLERTGDYEGLSVLRFYLVYRALVRALARALLARQHHAPSQDPFRVGSAASYTRLATRYAHAGRGAIFIMHGLSGCGKSTIATALVASLGAVRIRSDVERKRLYGFSALGRTGSAPGSGIYTEAATRATYGRLHEIARSAAQAGFPVIVDAAFLKHSQREDFRRLAEELRLPFAIVSVDAPADILRERLRERSRSGSDASEADPPVLQQQIATQEPLSQAESSDALLIDGARSFAGSARKAVVETLAARARLDSGGIGGGVIPLRQPRAPQYNGEIESAG
ncbi:MAG TPA: AAA family ATPase, partial [Burkholderiales bacterium]|nr:AAA family ATPase [Burkholderiales bacterium]